MLTTKEAALILGSSIDPRDGKEITLAKIKAYLGKKEIGRKAILAKFRGEKETPTKEEIKTKK